MSPLQFRKADSSTAVFVDICTNLLEGAKYDFTASTYLEEVSLFPYSIFWAQVHRQKREREYIFTWEREYIFTWEREYIFTWFDGPLMNGMIYNGLPYGTWTNEFVALKNHKVLDWLFSISTIQQSLAYWWGKIHTLKKNQRRIRKLHSFRIISCISRQI